MIETLQLILGGCLLWAGAVANEELLHSPITILGFNLRMMIPSIGSAFWTMIGICLVALPKFGDRPGDKRTRVKYYFRVLVIGAVISYLILLLPYVAQFGPVRLLKDYSTGAFKPSPFIGFISGAVSFISIMIPEFALIEDIKHFLSGIGRRKSQLVRGRSLLSFKEAEQIAAEKLKDSEPGPFFGMVRLPDRVSTSHFLVCGTTGAGKTTLLRLLMQSVLPNVGRGETRALIYDAKQDILSILKGMNLQTEVVTLNPFDERCAGWDIAKDVTSPAVAEQVASILIPSEKGGSNPYFYQAARSLLTGVMMAFIIKSPGKWSLADVLNALRTEATLKSVLLSTEHTAYLVERYFANEKVANDVMSTLDTKVRAYQYVAAAWSRATRHISLSEWLTQEYILVLGNDEETRTAIDAINQVIFKRLSELVIAQPESKSRRTWFFLDELKEAGKLEGLTSLLTKGRSKGACVVLGFQDIEGLSVAYGDNRTAREIVGLCANKAILRTDSPTTAEWASSLFGAGEMLEIRVTESSGTSGDHSQKSTSTSEHLQKRESVLASEFMSLPMSGPENGLNGYYIIPEIGAYRVRAHWSFITDMLDPIDSDFPNVVKRPNEHQYLSSWNNTDKIRLGLCGNISLEKSETKEQVAAQIATAPRKDLLGGIIR